MAGEATAGRFGLSTRALVVVAILALGAFTISWLQVPVATLVSGRQPGWLVVLGWTALLLHVALFCWGVGVVLTSGSVTWWVLGAAFAQLVLAFVMFVPFGRYWIGMPLLGFTQALLVTTGWFRIGLAVVVTVIYLLMIRPITPPDEFHINAGEWVMYNALYIGMIGLARLARELEAARATLTRLAVGQERLRLARDLNDSLGRSLSAALLKLELAARLRDQEPDRAGQETREAKTMLFSAVGQMQELVSGMRNVPLSQELDSAKAVLTAAGITTSVAGAELPVSGAAAEVLARVVREGATNVLRHSSAGRSEFVLSRAGGCVQLTINNDGVRRPAGLGHGGGQGLDGLRAILAGAGGELVTTSHAGEFTLHAKVPEEVPG